MFEKLAALADIADRKGEHELAYDSTQLIKNAQLFDALRTLFDPGHSGIDRDSKYWNRLQRGWSRGRMDRGVGLLLAINVERTKINKKIEELAGPIKDFQSQIAEFYNKVKSGADDFNSGSLRQELNQIKGGVKSMLKLVSGKELRRALDMRNRLNAQQEKALEKVKMDPEEKAYLMSVLKGEKPAGMSAGPQVAKPSEQANTMARWLAGLKMPRKSWQDGAKAPKVKGGFRRFMTTYHYNPIVIAEFFADPDRQAEGFEAFGDVFGEMLRDADTLVEYAAKHNPKDEAEKDVPGAPEEEVPAAAPAPAAEEAKAAPAPEAPPSPAPASMFTDEDFKPRPKPQAPGEDDVMASGILSDMEKQQKAKKDREEAEERNRDLRDLGNAYEHVTNPTASRQDRQITRLGRVRKLKSI